ncbi:hypothetical protein [Winogradskyella sp.]|uniref:hypothetical protein n=1 Tax=Winogradskyella sp. TaxID=1883156 RepID=UPI003F69675D
MRTSVFLFHLLELTAAISASIYWLKTKDKSIKPFVWYLWFIVCLETIEKSSGLINMEKRSELINAEFNLTSEKDKGTQLKIKYNYRVLS